MDKAWLILSDGSVYEGRSFGAQGEAAGEVVFNTGMTGYQEILTDPSYAGQIVVMTCPHIGNVGVNPDDVESIRPRVRGFVVSEYCPSPSNWRATLSLHQYLEQHGVIAIDQVDTRALTRQLRIAGVMPAMITTQPGEIAEWQRRARALPPMNGQDMVREVTCQKVYEWNVSPVASGQSPVGEALPVTGDRRLSAEALAKEEPATPLHIVVYDFGVKQNILRSLAACGARVTIVPATTPADEALERAPDGILLSNGPGDPAAVTYAAATVRRLIGRVPLFGICLGHQILGHAVGGTTFKLKFGHRGANQPVQDLRTRAIAITAQNHGFAVDPDSLPSHIHVTHVNLNDQTVEGMVATNDPVFSCQYHPEASPGPHDSCALFADFIQLCRQSPVASGRS